MAGLPHSPESDNQTGHREGDSSSYLSPCESDLHLGRQKMKRILAEIGERSLMEEGPVKQKKPNENNSALLQTIMDSVSADDMEPAATQEMMKREIDKLRREIKDLEEDLKNEKKQRLRAEKELKDWKDMHDVVQDFRSAVGQWKNTMLVKHFPDPAPQEDTTTKSGCEQMDDFVQTKLLEWGLEEFLLIFEAEKIDKESFLLLDGSSLQTLIPFVGPRLKFQKHLKALLEEPNRETTECSFSQGPSTQQRLMMMMMVENGSLFNIREILCRTPEGNKLVTSLDENGLISVNERRSMVRMLVSHLLEACGENPTSDIKAALAASVVEQFPCLKDCQGSGYDAWYTPARKSKPATGFLEERLRNVRKRLHRGRPTDSTVTETTLPESPIILPEATISEEAAFHMTEWLKENMWPREQVTDYMQETAVYRAQWIRNNEAKTVPDIISEFPRLVDTPGMLSRDFSILHPDKCSKLTERWNLLCAEKIICLAKKEKADLPSNVDNLSTERRGELALQLLPRLIPLAPYKVGKKVSRPSKRECQKAFIDEKPEDPKWLAIEKGLKVRKSLYNRITTADYKKYTCQLLTAVFGREILATRSLHGRKSHNSLHATKEALPAQELSALIEHVRNKFGVPVGVIKAVIRSKLNNEDKLWKKRGLQQ